MTAAKGWTNRGCYRILAAIFNGAVLPSNFYLALVTSAATPGCATNLLSDLTEIVAGNGYTSGGTALNLDATDFPGLTEDDVNDKATVNIVNVVHTPSGGSIPAAGDGARYAVLTDDNVVVTDREVWHWWDLGKDRRVTITQDLTISAAQIALYSAGTVA